jgi:hypothetical protein
MSLPIRFAGRILRFNRLVRIIITFLIALGWALLLTMVSQMLLAKVAADSQPSNAIFYVFVVIAFLIYFAGWRLLVGPVGNPPQPATTAGWYSLLGILAFIAAIVLVVVSLMVINQTI